MNAIITFLKSDQRNAWINVDNFSVYVRKGFHRVDNNLLKCFDIANITNNGARGKGKFKQLLNETKNLLESNEELRDGIQAIYVESVLNNRLAISLPTMGFELVSNTEPPSFSMKLNLREE